MVREVYIIREHIHAGNERRCTAVVFNQVHALIESHSHDSIDLSRGSALRQNSSAFLSYHRNGTE